VPATESTWRNLKTVHVIFGVSSVVLLLSTIWMMAADHNRTWKTHQRDTRRIDVWTANSRVDEQDTEEYEQQRLDLQQQLDALQEATLTDSGKKLLQEFIATAKGTESKPAPEEDVEAAELIAADVAKLEGFTGDDKDLIREKRMDLYNRMQDLIDRVIFREKAAASGLKVRRAQLDKASADYSLAVGNGESADKTAALQEIYADARDTVVELTTVLQNEKTHREELESIFKKITADRDAADKNLKDHAGKLDMLVKARDDRGDPLKQTLEMPILDAFGGPLKPDQIWLPNLTLNNNFRDVARFDRCITCHQGIDKTQAGSATQPAYAEAKEVELLLPTPKEAPKPDRDDEKNEIPLDEKNAERIYGLRFAKQGLLKDSEVSVSAVYPNKFGAQAGLMSGDTILRINDGAVSGLEDVLNYLLFHAKWDQPLKLTVRRGLPHPYCAHPKLDLFVGSLSPHPMGKFGCTICHQGQGSATSFEWASHTPNSPHQGVEWSREYGWFNNHHWIFPMMPEMFAESSCLKCHHEVVDLEPSAKFPDPPAPKLVHGYELIREFGCFGCHEVNGFAGPEKRVGPDLRAEPNFFAAAKQIRADSGFEKLADDVKQWVDQIIASPAESAPRNRLREFLIADANDKQPKLSPESQKLEAVLKDVETPGVFRKVGPSLRHLKSKVGYEWLYSWVRNPTDFRPSTKMPRFFGLWNHLVPDEKKSEDDKVSHSKSAGLEEAEKYEPVEIRAITSYLLKASQPFEYLEPFKEANLPPSVERGKKVFETRGCLACHQHDNFPQAKAEQGPNLSRMGAKLKLEPYGAKWLYSWVREPNRYHARTVMPNTMLTPIKDAPGERAGSISDPAADATAYLMQSTGDWKPENVPAEAQWSQADRKALYDLALLHLKDKFPEERAKKYLEEGIPLDRAVGIKGDEASLVRSGAADKSEQAQIDRMLTYVGRRTISKYGCSGCHDIAGYEDAKPIGTALADWGRKDPSKLAFEQVSTYITHHAWPSKKSGGKAAHGGGHEPDDHAHGQIDHDNLHFEIEELAPNEGWLMEKLLGHEREGFIWQKLREPRSYDFKKTETKTYNERLRMPQFRFTQEETEAVMTFVLGLVSEPPAPQYLATYANKPREKAIVEGTKVVEKFNCGGCHQLDFASWDIAFKPGELGKPAAPETYPFLSPHFAPDDIKKSQVQDRRGMVQGRIYGRPLVDGKGQSEVVDLDEKLFPEGGTGVRFELWQDVLLDGAPWLVGGKMPVIPDSRVTAEFDGRGGDLGNWIYPAVVADEQKNNPNVNVREAWGWLPPPLIGEGQKVQTNWLHDFLLDPYPIRPAAVLRMPKFNMSSADATALVEYFAARDNAPSPYEFNSRSSNEYLTASQVAHPTQMREAMNITNAFCVKCHVFGDFVPTGSNRALAPQLTDVHQRMRPEYVRRWTAWPSHFLPYTGMPVNISYKDGVPQDLFKGTSTQQLDGVVDLLMNWDRFTKQQFKVKPLIDAMPTAPATPAAPNQTSSTN
jgi:hypothetical protein